MLEHPSIHNPEVFESTWHPDDALLVPSDIKVAEQSDSAGSGTEIFDEQKLFLEIVAETTHILFERAMEQNDMWLAFTQVQDSQKYGLSHYPEMHSRLIKHIEQTLTKSDIELADDYRALLDNIKKELSEATFAHRFVWAPGGSKQRRVPREEDPEYLQTLRETTFDLFENTVSSGLVGLAYDHLKRACALGLEEYPTMKEKFLALLDSELAKSDEQVGGEYRRRLEEWRDCLKVECWTQGTVAQ